MNSELTRGAIKKFLANIGLDQLGEGNWEVFNITHTVAEPTKEVLKDTRNYLHSKLPDELSGIYVYQSVDGTILYIGKAKKLYDRVYSHYRETYTSVGGDKSGVWHYFFNSNPGELKIYWTKIGSERQRHIVEQCLEEYFGSKFDEEFPTGKRVLPR